MRARTWKVWGVLALLAVATLSIYVTRLGYAPIYLMHDESQFALQAESMASTGRDLTGHLLPLYFTEPEFPAGRDPLIIYATALVLKLRPLSEAAVRLPTALVGVLNVLLMFLVARRAFASDGMGLLAAAMMALTPAHFIRSRLALSPMYSLPFILAWLFCLARFADRGERRSAMAAAGWLGLGMYSYLACMVMMPVYLLMTLALIVHRREARPLILPALGVFLLTLLPMAAWYVTHADRYTQIVEAYRLYNADASTALPGGRGGGVYEAFRLRLGLFWHFFRPDFLFLSGDTSLINSTRQIGIFPMAFAVLLPMGAYRCARGQGGAMGVAVLLGLVTAPLATILSGQIEMNRVMFVLPFGVLTAAFGVQALRSSPRRMWRWVGVALLATIPLQFWGFYGEYMGAYRAASSGWFGGDIRAALTEVLQHRPDPPPAVYISRQIPFADRYWRFYALAQHRRDWLDRAVYYDDERLDGEAVASGSMLVCAAGTGPCDRLQSSSNWSQVTRVIEPGGAPSFAVFVRR